MYVLLREIAAISGTIVIGGGLTCRTLNYRLYNTEFFGFVFNNSYFKFCNFDRTEFKFG